MNRVRVQCVNPQPTLAGVCTWKGTRTRRTIETWDGRRFEFPFTRKRCPKCGGPVKQAVP